MNKHNLNVGQSVFIRLARSFSAEKVELLELQIEKIGTKWAKLKHPYYRVSLENLRLGTDEKGGSQRDYGTVCLSKEAYRTHVEITKAWSEFCRNVRDAEHRRPAHVTLEGIKEARLKLGI